MRSLTTIYGPFHQPFSKYITLSKSSIQPRRAFHISTPKYNETTRFERMKSYFRTDGIHWSQLAPTQKIFSFFKTAGYASIILAGLGVVGITIYYLRDDSKKQAIIQSQYETILNDLKTNQDIIRKFGEPKGLYEVEWVSRRGRNHISHYFSNELGVKSLIMQFKVYANEREGDVYAEMIQNKEGEWVYHILIMSTAKNQFVIVDNRAKRLQREKKKGFFGFNLSKLKRPVV